MAILQKRTSKRQIPEAQGFSRTPISSVVNNSLGNAPALSSAPSQSITSGGSGSTKATPILTSTTGASPAVTNKTSTTPTSITTSPATTTRPTISKNPTSSSTSSKLMNALTGAAVGVGAGALIDKITGKPINNASNTVSSVINNAINKVVPKSSTPTKSDVTPKTGDTTPTTPTTPYQYPKDPSGGTPYDDNGNLMPGWQLDENNNPVWVGSTSGQVPVGESLSQGEEVVPKSSDLTPQYFQDDQGNYYAMNADGGYDFIAYADGSLPTDNSNTDSVNISENTWTDPDTGAVWTMGSNGEWSTDFVDPNANPDTTLVDTNTNNDNTDEFAKRGGLITMMKNGGDVQSYASGGVTQTYDDGSYTNTYDDGTVDFYDSEGRFYGSKSGNNIATEQDVLNPKKVTLSPTYGPATTDQTTGLTSNKPLGSTWPAGYVSNGDGTATQVFDDGSTITVDENLNPINSTNATDITSSGGGSRNWYDNLGSKLSTGIKDLTGISDATLGKITGALPAAGAGALVASLLGSNFGSSGSTNQGLDMSKVGVINPRTTNFGIGPTNFVDYSQYGTSNGNYTPNEELLHNLNAPGYNPVNPPLETPAPETPKMASGGLSSMSTPVASYYTFGQPADILANLGMRQQPPQNPPDMMSSTDQQPKYPTVPQQLDGKQSPLAMAQKTPQDNAMQMQTPQGTPPQMRSGGLPHVSNVPLVEGRMDFRNGSAVHGEGDGQSDDIPAMLADGEYVIDAETVAQIGNGSTKAGAQALDKFRENIRSHKRSAPVHKIPPKTKALTSYLKG
jgi:hypothetical protein